LEIVRCRILPQTHDFSFNPEAQKKNSYSKSNQLTQQKGTGEKVTSVADDFHTKHAVDAQKKNSYSKSNQLSQQKGTGDNLAQPKDIGKFISPTSTPRSGGYEQQQHHHEEPAQHYEEPAQHYEEPAQESYGGGEEYQQEEYTEEYQ
jgi:hypothetical protein